MVLGIGLEQSRKRGSISTLSVPCSRCSQSRLLLLAAGLPFHWPSRPNVVLVPERTAMQGPRVRLPLQAHRNRAARLQDSGTKAALTPAQLRLEEQTCHRTEEPWEEDKNGLPLPSARKTAAICGPGDKPQRLSKPVAGLREKPRRLLILAAASQHCHHRAEKPLPGGLPTQGAGAPLQPPPRPPLSSC